MAVQSAPKQRMYKVPLSFYSTWQSHHIEVAQGDIFYGTEYDIRADLGPVGNTEKKIGADYEQLLRAVFSSFHGEKNQKYCSVRTKKFSYKF